MRARLVLVLPVALLSIGCSGGSTSALPQPSDADAAAIAAPPSAASDAARDPVAQDPEPLLRTLPRTTWNPRFVTHNAFFQGLSSVRPGVGQTVLVTEPFELERIELYVESTAVFALPTFFDFPFETPWQVLREHVYYPGAVDDLGVTLALHLYRSAHDEGLVTARRPTPGSGGDSLEEDEVIRLADLVLVSEQVLQGPVRAGTGTTSLRLAEPVVLTSGYWMLAFSIHSVEGDLDVLDLPIRGMQSGNNRAEFAVEGNECEYQPSPDAYPEGAFYWLELEPEAVFTPGFAKVEQCVEYGRYEEWTPFNPGDIGLDLYGTPTG